MEIMYATTLQIWKAYQSLVMENSLVDDGATLDVDV